MGKNTLDYVQALVPAFGKVESLRTSALEGEKDAAATLLKRVIEIVLPALHSIGDRIPDLREVIRPDGRRDAVGSGVRFVAIGRTDVETLLLRENGELCAATVASIRSGTAALFEDARDAVNHGWTDVEQYIAKLVQLLETSLPGMGKRSSAAVKRAAKLNAALVLLSK